MTKPRALRTAIDITKTVLGSAEITFLPNDQNAKDVADFIEVLASRLESMGEID